MKKILLLAFTLVTCQMILAQNPFEQFGYKGKILTATNGKFNEFHDLDSVVQIGSILLDVHKLVIVGNAPIDTVTLMPSPSILSRWLSPDPHSSKYYNISPYTFVADNPIRYTDPDGRDIVNPNGKSVVTIDQKTNQIVIAKNASADVRQVVSALIKTKAGTEVVRALIGSETKTGFVISKEAPTGIDPQTGKKSIAYGYTTGEYNDKKGIYDKATVTLYKGSFDLENSKNNGLEPSKSGRTYEGAGFEEFLNGVGAHEGTHALDDPKLLGDFYKNCSKCDQNEFDKYMQKVDFESGPDKVEDASRAQYQQQKKDGN